MINFIGKLIQEKRRALGLSVRKLAILANINHTDVTKLEHNKIQKPSINTLLSLSKILDVNLLAAYLEGEEKYLKYQLIIEKCAQLTDEQLLNAIKYINSL